MRINYLSLLNPFIYNGGGEKNLRDKLIIGLERGHEIKLSYVWPTLNIDRFDSPDLVILTDLYNYSKTRRPRFLRQFFPGRIIQEIILNGRYVHFDNAYSDICDLSYLPCNGRMEGINCSNKHGLSLLSHGNKCFRKFTESIYRNSLLNVFVSPLHRRVVQGLLGEKVVGKYYEGINFIDVSKFCNLRLERDIEFLFVGLLSEAKGLEEMRRHFAGQEIVLVGASGNDDVPGFGRWLGPIPYEEIPGLMNRAKHFVFLPRWPEPFGRVVAEAALCGCELIVNENVGATSFGLDLADPQTYLRVNEEFWEEIENLLI